MNLNFKLPIRTRAFTLIEVMVALSIVALSLAAVISESSNQVRNATEISERTYANWIALNKITEIRLSNAAVEVSETDDEVRYAETDWTLRTTISETGIENLYGIDVVVSFAGSEDGFRPVTGFVGPPGIPGQANLAWTRGSQGAGDAP